MLQDFQQKFYLSVPYISFDVCLLILLKQKKERQKFLRDLLFCMASVLGVGYTGYTGQTFSYDKQRLSCFYNRRDPGRDEWMKKKKNL